VTVEQANEGDGKNKNHDQGLPDGRQDSQRTV